jgi:hypothetical protein
VDAANQLNTAQANLNSLKEAYNITPTMQLYNDIISAQDITDIASYNYHRVANEVIRLLQEIRQIFSSYPAPG